MLGQGGNMGTHWEGAKGGWEQVTFFCSENDAAFLAAGLT
jgi:hypothetical protein